MSSSGTYSYHPKVAHENKVFSQMTSAGYQKPFFFGGSQVPLNLGIPIGSGLTTPYISHTAHKKVLGMSGRGINTTVQKNHKIYLPTGKL